MSLVDPLFRSETKQRESQLNIYNLVLFVFKKLFTYERHYFRIIEDNLVDGKRGNDSKPADGDVDGPRIPPLLLLGLDRLELG